MILAFDEMILPAISRAQYNAPYIYKDALPVHAGSFVVNFDDRACCLGKYNGGLKTSTAYLHEPAA